MSTITTDSTPTPTTITTTTTTAAAAGIRPALRTGLDPRAEVDRLAPVLQARAREGERLRTMPTDLVDELAAAGLFHLGMPRLLGGLELDPISIVEVVEAVSYADGSAGWTTMIGNSSAFLAWLDPAVGVELVRRVPLPRCASVFAPTALATEAADGSLSVSGRWAFASGCLHSDLFLNGCFVTEGGVPRMLPTGPDWRFGVLDARDVTVEDTWEAMGLQGTGSHDVVAVDAHVAADHVFTPFTAPARHDGPLWRFPFYGLLGTMMSGVPLGIAQRALDELAATAATKRRAGRPGPTIAEDAHLQQCFAGAERRLRAARALLVDVLGAAWDTACNGDVPTRDQLADLQMGLHSALDAGLEATQLALRAGGATSVMLDRPIQRCFRDLHTVAQHLAFGPEASQNYARTRFGLDG